MTKISRMAERGFLRVVPIDPRKFGNWSPAWLPRKVRARLAVEAVAFVAAAAAVVYGTMLVKEARVAPPLAVMVDSSYAKPAAIPEIPAAFSDVPVESVEFVPAEALEPEALEQAQSAPTPDAGVRDLAPAGARWFNGRPIRVKGVLKMRVTAYSPDERSCGDSADGITATLHSVETNNFQLVAADPRVLKYGSLITVPGYAGDQVVPVLDCGGKIKGNRLDLLYPTHEQARKWGSQMLAVTVWEYADGKPAPNPRKVR